MEVLFVIYLFAQWILSSQAANSTHYIAAVVEYHPHVGNVTANLMDYLNFIEDASKNGADIIVFPENGLNGRGPLQEDMRTAIPSPEENITLCDVDTTNYLYNAAIKQISCSARANNIYVLVNLAEISPCHLQEGCTVYKYNTNVVFNRQGVIITRYRKANLYIEPGYKAGPLEPSYFDTDFGVRFGTFICFDIIFNEPTLRLTREMGIKHIAFSTAWYANVPFFNAIQEFHAWSYEQDVTMLVAGYNAPENGTAGSAIFQGRAGPIYMRQPDTPTSAMYIASVAKEPQHRQTLWLSSDKAKHGLSNVKTIHPRAPQAYGADSKQTQIKLIKQDLTLYETVLLETVTPTGNVCDGEFCCEFEVEYSVKSNKHSYRAVAFDGVSYESKVKTTGMQVCAIVSCNDDSLMSCGARIDPQHSFTHISIAGNFIADESHIMASTLREGNELGLVPLLSDEFKYDKFCHSQKCQATIQSTKQLDNIMTFGINARIFSRDGQNISLPKVQKNISVTQYHTTLMWWSIAIVSVLTFVWYH